MTFQFLCPQGHLLEGEESQMGQQCDCPMCGMRFIIPTIAGAAPAANLYGQEQVAYDQSGYNPGGYPASDPSAGFGYADPTAAPFDPFGGQAPADPLAEAAAPLEPEGPKLVHIPCPAGHELETPYEMIGQDVLCPFCGVQFNLRYKDSVEYKAERAAELERKEIQAGKMWFQWAIIASVVVLAGLIGMVIYTMQSK